MTRNKVIPIKKKNTLTKQSNRAALLNLHVKGEIFKMAKIGTQKVVTIEGVDYTLQFPGTREKARIFDKAQTEIGGVSQEKLSEEIFKKVIVDPKVSWEYFDGNEEKDLEPHEGFDELMKEAMTFLRDGK